MEQQNPFGDLYAGDTWIRNFVFYADEDKETRYDLTDHTVTFTMKESLDDPDASAKAQVNLTLTDASEGEATLTVPKATTAAIDPGYYYVNILDTDSSSQEQTRLEGQQEVKQRGNTPE